MEKTNLRKITKAMDSLTHGVYVLGVHTPEKDNLMTAAWLSQVSESPAMVSVAVSSSHLTADLIKEAGRFTVSVLTESQKETALSCGTVSGRKSDKTALVSADYTGSGIPVIRDAAAQMECVVRDVFEILGNHTLFIAEVTEAASATSQESPLLYHAKEFFS